MKLNCHRLGRWADNNYARIFRWHKWFAWYPVTVEDGNCIWLEYVARCRVFGGRGDDYWSYRERNQCVD